MSEKSYTPDAVEKSERGVLAEVELPPNPSRNPGSGYKADLSSLSANFSTESLSIDQSDTPVTPSTSSFAPNSFSRFHGNDSSLSLNGSPANVTTPSYYSHHRASSNSTITRPLPRSVFFADAVNDVILEDGSHGVNEYLRLPPKSSEFHSKRHSGNFSAHALLPSAYMSHSGSPSRSKSPVRASTSPHRKPPSPTKLFAFNFEPQEFGDGFHSPAPLLKPAQRKGHRYKHSSVSMNMFQEPLPMAETHQQLDLIPDLFIIPNKLELLYSTTSPQKFKLLLAVVHSITSAVVFLGGVRLNQPSFSTLAHLVFYDSLGSIIIACVDIMSNFDAWSESSIAYPFGLGRLEVLAGFALSTSLIMVGCDLISHFVEEMILDFVNSLGDDSNDHNSHHIHATTTGSTNWFLYELILIVVLCITWLASICITDETSITELLEHTDKNSIKDRNSTVQEKGILDNALINDSKKKESWISHLKALFKIFSKNPIRVLTLVDSLFLSIVPFIPKSFVSHFSFDLNEASTFVVASTLCYVGWKMALQLGGILLLSFPYSDYDYNVLKASIYDKILGLSNFKPSYAISKIFLAKANHRLYIVGLDISIKGGSSDDESRLIFDVTKIITHSIKVFDDESQVETTISVSR